MSRSRRFLFPSLAASVPVRSVGTICLSGSSSASVGPSRRQRPSFPRRWEVCPPFPRLRSHAPNNALQRTAGVASGVNGLPFSPPSLSLSPLGGSLPSFSRSDFPSPRPDFAFPGGFFAFPLGVSPFPSGVFRFPCGVLRFPRRVFPFPRPVFCFPGGVLLFPGGFLPVPSLRFASHRLTTRSSEQRLAVGSLVLVSSCVASLCR